MYTYIIYIYIICVCICVYIYNNFFVCSSIDGYLCCFHILTIINNVAMNIACIFWISIFISYDIHPMVELVDHIYYFSGSIFVVVQLLSHVLLFVTAWAAACQAPLSFIISQFAQTQVLWIGDAIQPSHSLLCPSPPTLSFFQHQCLFQCVGSLHQEARVLELQL